MPKQPFEYYVSTIRGIYHKSVENHNKTAEQFDSVIVWLVGFSVGGIALLVSNLDKLKIYSSTDIRIITSLLALSVLTGVIGRIAYAVCRRLATPIYSIIDSKLIALENPNKFTKLKGDETAEQILFLLKVDFELDAMGLKQQIDDTEPHLKNEIDKKAREFYQENINASMKQKEQAQQMTSDAFTQTLKLNKEEEEGKQLHPIWMRRAGRISSYSYILCCLTFAFAVVFFAGAFIARIG